MKYVRTKDGIFDLLRYDFSYGANEDIWLADRENKCDYHIKKKDIIKQSDNLRDLCDCFVFVSPELTYPQLVIPMNFDYVKKEFEPVTIYCAIWTVGEHGEPILKSVATMNKEGEWELL